MKKILLAVAVACLFSTPARGQDSEVFYLPLGVGLRIPAYDRVNGVSIPWGPDITIPPGRVTLVPTVTYRSHLGKIDPAVKITAAFGHMDTLAVYAGRGTFSNDAWIRSDLVNSLAALAVGSDARNYFRADRATAELWHSFRTPLFVWSPFVGFLHELDWSTGIATPHDHAPWSLLNRDDTLKMRRVNPKIAPGHVTSGLAGVRGRYEQNELKGSFNVQVEQSFDEPASADADHFTQATIDAKAEFPTFGMQSFEFKTHALASSGSPPPQRYSYLGGAGTLATVDLLAFGGDKMFFAEAEYKIPLSRPLLPFVGTPVISALYAVGSAGVGELPDFIQNIGLGVGVKLLKVAYHIDPNYKKTSVTHKNAFTIGFSFAL
jgi:hypothetical protein